MYIKEAEFHYFLNFKTGMGVDKIFFDFTTRKNPICVILGPNGIGKTSLLSLLTPFATMGTLDPRESNKIIIPGEEGYERLVFVDELRAEEYEIEYFFLPNKDTFSIKGYFRVNGNELNPNGNVTSCKALIYEYMDVDISFLKLIRIGKNVSNLIQAKATERKTFMGKILEDLEWYLKEHKRINQKEHDLSVLMKGTMESLMKLNIESVDASKAKIRSLTETESDYEKKIAKKEEESNITQYQMNELHLTPDSRDELKAMEKELTRLSKVLKEVREQGLTSEQVKERLAELKIKHMEARHSLDFTSLDIEHNLQDTNERMNQIHSLEENIRLEKESLNIQSLESYLVELKKKANEEFRQAFIEVPVNCTKEEFEAFFVLLRNLQEQLNHIYEYGKAPIKEVIKSIRKNEDVPSIVAASLLALEAKEDARKLSIIDRLIQRYAGLSIDCPSGCALKNMQRELQELKDAESVTNVKFTPEFYQWMRLSYDVIKSFFVELSKQKELIQKFPRDVQAMFTTEQLFARLEETKVVYDERVLNELLSFLTERANYFTLEESIKKTTEEIARLRGISHLEQYQEELKEQKKKLSHLNFDLSDLKEQKQEKEIALEDLEEEIRFLSDAEIGLTDYEKKEAETVDLRKRMETYLQLDEKFRNVQMDLMMLYRSKDEIAKTRVLEENHLATYKELSKQLQHLKGELEDYGHLKFALSSKTGIPLFHIKRYLKKTVTIANQIIDIAYDGALRLDPFEIDETNFLMPYRKNGVRVEDVSSASQGEESFFNLAISSALRAQAITRFNIGLYDEVDSEFDDHNRQHFIPVLEKTMELNNVEQAFLITHNLMFRQYPVDTIDLEHPEQSTIKVVIDS